jgi:hypothetical protein
MTPEEEQQAKKEFTKLKRSATLLGIEYTDETTFEDLTVKVAEAKVKVHLEELQEEADSLGLEYADDATVEQLQQLIEAAKAVPPVELPLNAHTYYVWKDGTFIKYFINEDYKGEALKHAQQFADEIGGTIEASGTFNN